jgi:hypothetical protein
MDLLLQQVALPPSSSAESNPFFRPTTATVSQAGQQSAQTSSQKTQPPSSTAMVPPGKTAIPKHASKDYRMAFSLEANREATVLHESHRQAELSNQASADIVTAGPSNAYLKVPLQDLLNLPDNPFPGAFALGTPAAVPVPTSSQAPYPVRRPTPAYGTVVVCKQVVGRNGYAWETAIKAPSSVSRQRLADLFDQHTTSWYAATCRTAETYSCNTVSFKGFLLFARSVRSPQRWKDILCTFPAAWPFVPSFAKQLGECASHDYKMPTVKYVSTQGTRSLHAGPNCGAYKKPQSSCMLTRRWPVGQVNARISIRLETN